MVGGARSTLRSIVDLFIVVFLSSNWDASPFAKLSAPSFGPVIVEAGCWAVARQAIDLALPKALQYFEMLTNANILALHSGAVLNNV